MVQDILAYLHLIFVLERLFPIHLCKMDLYILVLHCLLILATGMHIHLLYLIIVLRCGIYH